MDKLLAISDAAKVLRISILTLRRWELKGRLSLIRTAALFWDELL